MMKRRIFFSLFWAFSCLSLELPTAWVQAAKPTMNIKANYARKENSIHDSLYKLFPTNSSSTSTSLLERIKIQREVRNKPSSFSVQSSKNFSAHYIKSEENSFSVVLKDKDGNIIFSHPNLTKPQIEQLLEEAEKNHAKALTQQKRVNRN